jgi:thiamine-monophosphate kinase
LPLRETELIARIRDQARKLRTKSLITGIGDDCAVLRLPRGHELLVTTDFSLEGVHFRREWHPADAVGHRCLTRGLSDIAAMGGEPVAAFLSLAIPADLPQDWIDDFFDGLLRLAKGHKVPLTGGDTAESRDGVLADIVVTGSAPRGKALRRSGARPGDQIYVTGELGGSAGVVRALFAGAEVSPKMKEARRHFYPEPRIEIGRRLSERGLATACIDISDGLSTDLGHICDESRVGAVVEEGRLPLSPLPALLGIGDQSVDLALNGGEDYELLFTARTKTKIPGRIAGMRVTRIGAIVKDKRRRMWIIDRRGEQTPLLPRGWEHFR